MLPPLKRAGDTIKIEGIPMPSHTNNSWPKSYKIKFSTHQSFPSNNLEMSRIPLKQFEHM